MSKGVRDVFQERIRQALVEGDVRRAVAIRAEMYRETGEKLDQDDVER